MPKKLPSKKVEPKKEIRFAEYKEAKLVLPKVPEIYRLKRVHWLTLNMHRLLQRDPTAIPIKSYLELLDTYVTLIEKAQKKGLHTLEGRRDARSRVDSLTMAKEVQESDTETDDGFQEPFSMGT